jgi:hypothetical protein
MTGDGAMNVAKRCQFAPGQASTPVSAGAAAEARRWSPGPRPRTVAHVLITVAVIVTGLVFAFTEHGSGARRLFGVAFGGALALGALSFMTAVGWAGATF